MSKLGHLIQMLINLQYKKISTAGELSEILEVDKKTVYRYINNLSSSNIPINTVKGRYGGFYIDDNLYMKPPKLTFEELQALIAAEYVCKNSDFPFKGHLTTAIGKIHSICTKEDEELKKLLGDNKLNISELCNGINMDEKVKLINTSMDKGKSIKIGYLSEEENILRQETIDPYTLLFKDGKWFVIGYSQLHDKVKDYFIDRIIEVSITDYIYIKPKYFSLKKYLLENWGVFEKGDIEVKIKFSKNYSKHIKGSRWCSNQIVEELEDGSIIFAIHTSNTELLIKWILGFGENAEVIEPESLKENIIEELKSLSKIYKINKNDE